MKTLIFLICLSCFSVSAQSSFNSGFNDGYQSTLKDALIVRTTPPPPSPPLGCTVEDYKCGYREGVKKAAVVISAKRNSGSSSSSNSNPNQQSNGVFDFSGIAEYGASLDQQPKKTYVRTSPTQIDIKTDLLEGKTFKYVLMNDLYGNWPRKGIKANVKSAEKVGFKVIRDPTPISKRSGIWKSLPQEDIVVCKWYRTMKSTPLGGYTYDIEHRYTIKLKTMSGVTLYEAEYVNSTYEEVWYSFSKYVR